MSVITKLIAGRGQTIERGLFAVGLLCCLLGLIGLLRWGPSDPVSKVRVDGHFNGLAVEAVWPYVSKVLGEDLLAVDFPALAARLEQHPWIEKVALKRVWPDTLVIDIEEPVAIAQWEGLKGERGFVTDAGATLEAAVNDELVEIYRGPADSGTQFKQWQKYLAEATANSDWRVSTIMRSEFNQWRALVSNGDATVELRFGEQWQAAKWQRFQHAWQQLGESAKQVAYFDLRYRGGLAVGWRAAAMLKQAPTIFTEKQTIQWAQAPQGV